MATFSAILAVTLCVLLNSAVGTFGQAQVSITFPNNDDTVTESEGAIRVCVIADAPLSSTASVRFRTQGQSAIVGEDFEDATRTLTLRASSTTESQCFDIIIIQDNVVESPIETILVTLDSPTGNVVANDQIHTVNIVDTDRLSVSFSRSSYMVVEASPSAMVMVCTEIVNGSLANDDLEVRFGIDSLNNGTAVGGVDFVANLGDSEFQFVFDRRGQRESCISIGILDDDQVEDTEQFYLSLELIAGLSDAVEFVAGITKVTIEDNESASVTLSPNQNILVIEGNHTTFAPQLVCVILRLTVDIGTGRDVVFNVTTMENTATEGDFQPLKETLTIPRGSQDGDSVCFNVTIIGDNVLEQDEMLTVELTLLTPDEIIDGGDSLTIIILHDGDVNICPILEAPRNGNLQATGYSFQSTATYSCNVNFQLNVTQSTRKCQANGTWSGETPKCLAICGPLGVQNGQVLLESSIEGSIATYSCLLPYTLNGNGSRVCENSGQWSGQTPTCELIDCDILVSPPNGMVVYDESETAFSALAIYRCDQGFRIVEGNAVRMCGNDGEWTGSAAVCGRGSSAVIVGSGLGLAIIVTMTIATTIVALLSN